MPEGHTIHRIARDHTRDLAGLVVQVSSPQGRFAEGAAQVSGRRLLGVDAHGKHLYYRLQDAPGIHIHLGLYGKFRRQPSPAPPPVGQVRLRMLSDRGGFDLNGPNRCELATHDQWRQVRSRLGPDPLRADADPTQVWARVHRSRKAIGALLLDQAVIAGVGNIYRSEVLHQLDIHPNRPGTDVSRVEFDDLWALLVELMQVGVRYSRIVIADPADVGKPRSRMRRDERLYVYKKPHCFYCATPIETWLLAARKVFACPNCQT